MSGNIIGLRPIFLELDFWPKSHINGITFKAIKQEQLIFMKVSVKIFLKSYKAQKAHNVSKSAFIESFWVKLLQKWQK